MRTIKPKKLLTAAVALIAAFTSVVMVATTAKGGDGRVTICHIPPGNEDNAHEIVVSSNAVNAHLQHGDLLGACDTEVGTIPL